MTDTGAGVDNPSEILITQKEQLSGIAIATMEAYAPAHRDSAPANPERIQHLHNDTVKRLRQLTASCC